MPQLCAGANRYLSGESASRLEFFAACRVFPAANHRRRHGAGHDLMTAIAFAMKLDIVGYRGLCSGLCRSVLSRSSDDPRPDQNRFRNLGAAALGPDLNPSLTSPR